MHARTEEVARLAIARAMVGCAALLQLLLDYAILSRWLSPEHLRLPYLPLIPPPTATTLPWLAAAWLLSAIAFAAGWRVRVFGPLLAAVLFWRIGFDEQSYANHHYLLCVVTVLLTAGTWWPRGAMRLLQVQAVIMYAFAAISKMTPAFLNGEVMLADVWALRLVSQVVSPDVVQGLAELGAWSVVIVEGSLAALIAASINGRPAIGVYAAALGVMLHLGLATIMRFSLGGNANLVVFALASWAMYVPFATVTADTTLGRYLSALRELLRAPDLSARGTS
jgi:hypothetical protein